MSVDLHKKLFSTHVSRISYDTLDKFLLKPLKYLIPEFLINFVNSFFSVLHMHKNNLFISSNIPQRGFYSTHSTL